MGLADQGGDLHWAVAMADSSVNELVKLLRKANHDLNVVEHSLDKEFRQSYPENVCIFCIFMKLLMLAFYSIAILCSYNWECIHSCTNLLGIFYSLEFDASN